MERYESALVISVALVLAFRILLCPLRSSLWLDETGTYWAISGALSDVFAHLANPHFAQMPLFCLIMWAWAQVAGTSEIALRLPSVAAMVGTVFILHRIAARWVGPVRATYSAVLLFSISHIGFAAVDARPYALGLLMVTWSFYELLAWTDTGQLRHVIRHGIAFGLAIHFCYFFGAVLVGQIAYLLVAHRRRWSRITPVLALSPCITAVIVSPLIPYWLVILEHPTLHALAPRPSWTDLGQALTPPRWIVAWVAATGLWMLGIGRVRMGWDRISPRALAFALSWGVASVFFLFSYSLVFVSVYLPRYMLSYMPGMVLLGVLALSALKPASWRLATAALVVAMAIASTGGRFWTDHSPDNWRAASRLIRSYRTAQPDIPVLFAGPFVESIRLALPPVKTDQDWTVAPLLVYPIPGPVTVVPYDINDLNRNYMETVAVKAVSTPRFIVTAPYEHWSGTLLITWMQGYASPAFSCRFLMTNPYVLLFEKRPAQNLHGYLNLSRTKERRDVANDIFNIFLSETRANRQRQRTIG